MMSVANSNGLEKAYMANKWRRMLTGESGQRVYWNHLY